MKARYALLLLLFCFPFASHAQRDEDAENGGISASPMESETCDDILTTTENAMEPSTTPPFSRTW